MNTVGLLFLIFGSAAVALMGFEFREVGSAFRLAAGRPGTAVERRRSVYFWEAAARNAWLLGALGSALNFTIALGSESGGIGGIAGRMIQALVIMLYGLVLAVVCLVPALKLAEGDAAPRTAGEGPEAAPAVRRSGSAIRGRIGGYLLFAATVAASIVVLTVGRPRGGPLPLGKILFHGPAILIVGGGAVVLALFMGRGVGARAWSLGFAMTGAIGLLMGLIQALFGFAHADVGEISSAIAFLITAVAFSLLGLAAVAAPLEDREVMAGRRDKAGPVSRALWVVFPLLAFIALVLTFIMVVTPMTKPAG
ncbi:MAG: hypothetical protein KA243_06125 [Candidatus Aminicenantes bacterium]|nr:hypothetical protein [Candidatus Aminicenantes bacterium]